ncbi:amidase, partial [Dietzia sp. SLG310A2-38A2]|uniref:amidase family protein n=1 Tax=Dietzia sp. SLG310A2-38A2 TaxID=1630643 RepID=UPI00321B1EB3|nr:amidase [Dietzia sp. SLG310A2-38A2]
MTDTTTDAAADPTPAAMPRRVHAFRDDALGYDDASALAERIRRREVSPAELVEAAIERCAAVDPVLGAMVHTDYDRARHRAAWVQNSQLSAPLAGVPSAFKDAVRVEGLPMTLG